MSTKLNIEQFAISGGGLWAVFFGLAFVNVVGVSAFSFLAASVVFSLCSVTDQESYGHADSFRDLFADFAHRSLGCCDWGRWSHPLLCGFTL